MSTLHKSYQASKNIMSGGKANNDGSLLYDRMYEESLKEVQTPEIRNRILRTSRNDDTESSSTSESYSGDSSDNDNDNDINVDDRSGTPTTDEASMSSDNDELLEIEQNEGKKTQKINSAKKTVISLKPTTKSAPVPTKQSQALPKTSQQPVKNAASQRPEGKASTPSSSSSSSPPLQSTTTKPPNPNTKTKTTTATTTNAAPSTTATATATVNPNTKHQTTAFRVPTPSTNNHEALRKIQDLAEREKDLVKNIQEHAAAKALFNDEKRKFDVEKLEFEEIKNLVRTEYTVVLSVKENILKYRELQTISEAAIASSLETLKRKEVEIEEQMKALVAMQEANTKKLDEKKAQEDEDDDVMIVDKKSTNKKTPNEVKTKSSAAASKKLVIEDAALQMDVQKQQNNERKLLDLTKIQLQALVPKQTFDILDSLSYWGQQNVFQCFAYSIPNGDMELEIKNVSDANNVVFTMFVKSGYY